MMQGVSKLNVVSKVIDFPGMNSSGSSLKTSSSVDGRGSDKEYPG